MAYVADAQMRHSVSMYFESVVLVPLLIYVDLWHGITLVIDDAQHIYTDIWKPY